MDGYNRRVRLTYNDITCGIFRIIIRHLQTFLAKCQIGEHGFVIVVFSMIR